MDIKKELNELKLKWYADDILLKYVSALLLKTNGATPETLERIEESMHKTAEKDIPKDSESWVLDFTKSEMSERIAMIKHLLQQPDSSAR